jgi:hypothetical protein
MRILTFWNRPIPQDTFAPVWHEGGRAAMELAIGITSLTYILYMPATTQDYLIGLVSFTLTAMCGAYLAGGFAAVVLRVILRRFWQSLGNLGCVLVSISLASLVSWQILQGMGNTSLFVPQTYSDHPGEWCFLFLTNIAFILMAGRGGAKLHDLWSPYTPPQRRSSRRVALLTRRILSGVHASLDRIHIS